MFCANCGKEVSAGDKFCAYCGSPVQTASSPVPLSPEPSMHPIPKKTVSPVLIGGISAAVLAAAVVAGSVFYFTSRDDVDVEETSASSEKREKKKADKKKDTPISEMEEEEEVPTVSKTAETLQNYLETELIPQYGTADLGTQIKEFENEDSYDDTYYFWTASAGLSDAKIYDLDQDGEEELLVFLLTKEDITLYIYEAEEDEVRQTAEYTQKRYSDMDGYDISWSLLTAKGTPYLFFSESGYGIFWDYSTTNAGLYRYDGNKLYAPLLIKQTQGGSSDFIHTAYQYNADGELLNEEVVLDEDPEHESDRTSDYFCQRVAELFGTYGISLDSEAAIQKNQSIYHDIAKADEYETLLHLEMQGESLSYPITTLHFNDFDSPWASYQRFLRREETVQMREDAWYYGDQQKEWTLDDIREKIINEYTSEYHSVYPSIEYAYLDCGNDGVEELAVRFVGLGIYAPDDDSDLTMIITCKNNSLEVVYSYETWARSYTAPLYHGCFPSGGSDGAGDHPFDMQYLDADGNLHTVYDARALGGWWFRGIEPDIYDSVFSSDPSAEVTHYEIDGADYYVMQSYDTDIDSLCQEYVSLCEQKGRNFVSDDEITELIEAYAGRLGIESDWLYEDELSWNYWY